MRFLEHANGCRRLLVDFPPDDLMVVKPRKCRVETFVRKLFGKQTEFNYLRKATR